MSHNLAHHVKSLPQGVTPAVRAAGVVQVATQSSVNIKKALSYTSIPPYAFIVCRVSILLDLTKITGGDKTVPSDKHSYHTQGR